MTGLEGFSPPTGKAAKDGGGRAEPRPGKPRQDVEACRASPAYVKRFLQAFLAACIQKMKDFPIPVIASL
jgi:hypothetical protein